jgi:hypothetical protein
MNLSTKFSLTIPSEAAKKASTWVMKCFSSGFSVSQSFRSCASHKKWRHTCCEIFFYNNEPEENLLSNYFLKVLCRREKKIVKKKLRIPNKKNSWQHSELLDKYPTRGGGGYREKSFARNYQKTGK